MSVYNIHDYGNMIADRARTGAYAAAIRARVTPGSVVLDIGAGPGILTLLACQAGARKVYAVEPDGVLQVAREAAAANGYADRIEFIEALSGAIDLPEKVDVIMTDVHGALPFFSGSVATILDARDRFLKPGGFVIPMRDITSVAPVYAPDAFGEIVNPWERYNGLDLTPGRRSAVNCWRNRTAGMPLLLGEPKVWAVLDYQTLQTANGRGRAGWTLTEAGQAHGLCLWFECETAPGHGYSNSPASRTDPTISRTAFFPWPESRDLAVGDCVEVEIRADVVGADYMWSWSTEIRVGGSVGPITAQFRQSEFFGGTFSSSWLRRSGCDFVPSPNRQASIDRMILDLLFAGITLEEISRRVSARFPERFPEWRKALTRVGEMSRQYSE